MTTHTEQERDKVQEENMEAGAAGTGPTRPEPKRLTRSRDDVVIAGVAAGLGRHLNIDPVIPRIGFVVASFAGGLGLLLYIVGWLLIPEEGSDRALGGYSARDPLRSIPPWIIAGLLGIAALALVGEIGVWGQGAFLWSLILIGGGVLLYRMDTAPPRPDKPERPEGETAPVASAAPEEPGSVTESLPTVTKAKEPKVPKVRSYLGRYTFAAMLLILGMTAMLDTAGAFTLRAEQYPGLALLVLGAGLLAGTIVGRARSLILLGIFFIVPIALATSLINVPIEGGTGDRSYSPAAAAELERDFRLAAGRMEFDLTDLKWGTEPTEITATAVAGEILIYVPRGVTVELHGRVGAGAVDLFRVTRDGFNAEIESTEPASAGSPVLVINAEVSFGHVGVVRLPTPAKGTR